MCSNVLIELVNFAQHTNIQTDRLCGISVSYTYRAPRKQRIKESKKQRILCTAAAVYFKPLENKPGFAQTNTVCFFGFPQFSLII